MDIHLENKSKIYTKFKDFPAATEGELKHYISTCQKPYNMWRNEDMLKLLAYIRDMYHTLDWHEYR